MFLREKSDLTLEDLANKWSVTRSTWGGGLHQVVVNLDPSEGDQATLTFGAHEVPATAQGVSALAGFLDVPTKFLERVSAFETQAILANRIERSAEGDLRINYSSDGVTEVLKTGQQRVTPAQIAEVAMAVIHPTAEVVEHFLDVADLRLDVVVPEGFDRGWGGDRSIGDLTGGGIRLGQNRRKNLAPWVQPYMYRLACTNGYEMEDPGLRVDARGLEPHEVMASLEAEARRAFGRVESQIEALYDLRNQPLGEDRTGVLRRIAQESGLPDRTVGHLEDLLPAVLDESGTATMFDVINLITNLANSPSVRGSSARALQQVGGTLINDHAARCAACHTRLAQ